MGQRDSLKYLRSVGSFRGSWSAPPVQAGVNVLVSGQTGSGKTTLLNALGASIVGLDEREVTVEEIPELQLDRRLPGVALQSRGKNVEGAGEISIRDLVRIALKRRPTVRWHRS